MQDQKPAPQTQDQSQSQTQEQDQSQQKPAAPAQEVDYLGQVSSKIEGVENILVALSRNPTVDEMAAALGLTIYLSSAGKYATAIYSGATPNALEFLNPEQTFESDTQSLQDFIIALNVDKADHLRYKIDGEFVKVYITPYKTTIHQDDLEFSHGDYNVQLVIALNVPTPNDLDDALSEHGRIMHDASAIDITTDEPGKFGEIEWSDPSSSSVSEMVANLILALSKKLGPVDKDAATALLSGVIAATSRFSNEKTSPKTMELASQLMQLGADQQLISAHVADNVAIVGSAGAVDMAKKKENDDPTRLDIEHTKPVEEEPQQIEEFDPNDLANNEIPTTELVVATPVTENPKSYSDMMAEALATPLSEHPTAMSEPVGQPAAQPVDDIPDMNFNEVPTQSEDASTMIKEEPAALGEDSYIASDSKAVLQPLDNSISNPMPEMPAVQTEPIAEPAPAVSMSESTPVMPEPIVSTPELTQPEPAPAPAMPEPVAAMPEPIPAPPAPDMNILPPPPAPPVDMNNVSMPTMPEMPAVQAAPVDNSLNSIPNVVDSTAPVMPSEDSVALQMPVPESPAPTQNPTQNPNELPQVDSSNFQIPGM